MAEKITYIPGRIKSAAKGGHITGAVDILDDRLGRDQQDINQDTYRKGEVYSREETGEIISRTPETDVVVLSVPSGSTALDVLNTVPVADRPNKVFRVKNDSNTHYDEYGWTGSVWGLLASKDYGIDDTPTEGSHNWLTSDGIYHYIEDLINTDTEDYKFALTDKLGNVICLVNSQDELRVVLDIVAETINTESVNTESVNGVPAVRMITTDFFKVAWIDNNDNIIFGIDKDDNLVSGVWDLSVLKKIYEEEEVKYGKDTDIYKRNIEKDGILTNDAYPNPAYTKKFQALILTDSHLNNKEVENWKDAGDAFNSVDCLIHLGDMTNYLDPAQDNDIFWDEVITGFNKPTYIAIGNHDVGTSAPIVNRCRDDEDMYNRYVLPIINKGYLNEGEYQEGKCYYYHDFPKYKVRLIVLYPFESGAVFDTDLWSLAEEYDEEADILTEGRTYAQNTKVNVEGYTKHTFVANREVTVYKLDEYTYLDLGKFDSEHWELVSYDSTKPQAKNGGSFVVGDIVNVRGYTSYSIRCKSNVTLPKLNANYDPGAGTILYPRYNAARYRMWFSEEQIYWLCNALDRAGELGYTSVIACHYNLLGYYNKVHGEPVDYNLSACRFTSTMHSNIYDPYTRINPYSLISDIVHAYQNGGDVVIGATPREGEKYVLKYGNNNEYASDKGPEGYVSPGGVHKPYDDVRSIAEIVPDSEGPYHFDHSGNVLFICGHTHSDAILRSAKPGYDQTSIAFLAGVVENQANKDIIRDTKDGKFFDTITGLTVDDMNKRVHLTRIGADITRRVGEDGRLIKKDNEIIDF